MGSTWEISGLEPFGLLWSCNPAFRLQVSLLHCILQQHLVFSLTEAIRWIVYLGRTTTNQYSDDTWIKPTIDWCQCAYAPTWGWAKFGSYTDISPQTVHIQNEGNIIWTQALPSKIHLLYQLVILLHLRCLLSYIFFLCITLTILLLFIF
jgi:hypothetical protein